MKITTITQKQGERPTNTPNGASSGSVQFTEFDPADSPVRYQEPLIIALCGGEGAGKSRITGTAPGKIGVVPTERKTRQSVLAAAKEFGKTVIMPEEDLIRGSNPLTLTLLKPQCISQSDKNYSNWSLPDIHKKMQEISTEIRLDRPQPECCIRHNFRWFTDREKRVAYELAARDDVKTISIDSFGSMIEDISWANYGQALGVLDPKEFGFAPRQAMNQEIRAFLNALNHKNLILTHHLADVWKDGKPTKHTKPASSFSKIGHYTSVSVQLTRNKDANVEEGEPLYTLKVLDCQANASLIGLDLLHDDEITFAQLAVRVYDESSLEDWE